MSIADARHVHQEQLLLKLLQGCFGELDDATLALLRKELEWVNLAGGQTLMEQGAPGDAMYVSVSGRLRAYVRDEIGVQRMVREMSRGQVIGEMSLFTGEPRSATVVAIRESVLVRLSRAAFDQLVGTHPGVSTALARQLIQRLLKEQNRSLLERPVTMGLLPVSAGVDIAAFAARLAEPLARVGRVRTVDAASIEAELRPHGLSLQDEGAELDQRVALLLDEIEAHAEFVLLLGDDVPSSWTRRCTRHCDELLLVAQAAEPPLLHASEQACLVGRPPRSEVAEILVLLHGTGMPPPGQVSGWLARRAVTDHLHLRLDSPSDFERLARLQSRTGVGLVLGGGGARGFAHLGVLRALQERGVVVDRVGGTSIGAVMAALVASAQPLEHTIAVARSAFARNPTGDLNPLPFMSLIRGQRLKAVVREAMLQLFGRELSIEELWKPYFCIASNYSQAREERLHTGPLMPALLASAAIPGALPPVVRDGDLLSDGGTFNNFPVDVMQQQRGIGTVIGVDLSQQQARRIEFDEMPSWWRLALDRLRPRRRRRYRLPSLPAYLMNVTVLYSVSRRREARAAADLVFSPPLQRVGMLEWARFDEIVEQGYDHAREMLDRADPALLNRMGVR
jgi:NTE family protein